MTSDRTLTHSNEGSKLDTKMKSGFASGHVIHSRKKPKVHRFKYQMCWCLFDLDNLDEWFNQKLWGHNRWSMFGLYDKDYVNAEKLPIKQKIQQYIYQQAGISFNGSIQLFTHPRFLGYGFNSVNFYFCYEDDGTDETLVYIITEINNTPWGEKHLYFHDCSEAICVDQSLSFEFDKKFHISPFMDMQMNYQWNFKITDEQIAVKMWVKKQTETLLTVILDTKITPLVENGSKRFLLKRPFQPWKMSIGIYWQAFKLWCKKVPFYDHPKTKVGNEKTRKTDGNNN